VTLPSGQEATEETGVGDELGVSGGGCDCGCCGDTVEMVGPGDEREQLLELKEQVDERLAELETEEA
jgi:hypothetical protein